MLTSPSAMTVSDIFSRDPIYLTSIHVLEGVRMAFLPSSTSSTTPRLHPYPLQPGSRRAAGEPEPSGHQQTSTPRARAQRPTARHAKASLLCPPHRTSVAAGGDHRAGHVNLLPPRRTSGAPGHRLSIAAVSAFPFRGAAPPAAVSYPRASRGAAPTQEVSQGSP